MRDRYSAMLFSLTLVAAFALGLFIEPSESQANPRMGWKGEYFANQNLQGEPSITTYDDAIEMNWFNAAPYEVLPVDYFSVRWTTRLSFQPGIYRFRIGADDGVRFFINDTPIMEVFSDGTFQTSIRDVKLRGGEYQLRVEYFEEVGLAGVLVDWTISQNPLEVLNFEDQTIERLITPPNVISLENYNIPDSYSLPRPLSR